MDLLIKNFYINYATKLKIKLSKSQLILLVERTTKILLKILKTADLYCFFQNKKTLSALEIQQTIKLIFNPYFLEKNHFPLIIRNLLIHAESLVIKSTKENVYEYGISDKSIKDILNNNLEYTYKLSKGSIVYFYGLLISISEDLIKITSKKINKENKYVFEIFELE